LTPPPTAASAARVRSATAVPAPLRLPPAPRRVSGPVRRTRSVERQPTGVAAVLLHLVDHPWLERLIRGRAWIAIVAAALLGIVAMQVALLRVGAQIGGQTAAVNSMLQRNETMEATIGGLEASRGLGTSAGSLGMLYPPPGAITYLQLNPGDGALAADRIESPSAVALAAAAAHPLRTLTHAATTTSAATGATGGAATMGAAVTGSGTGTATTSGSNTTTGTGTPATSGTASTTGTAATTAGANTTGTTTSAVNTPAAPPSSGTPVTTPTASTPPTTATSGGATATTLAGGTTAPTTATSGAGGTATGG
jgi:hypothetical protein